MKKIINYVLTAAVLTVLVICGSLPAFAAEGYDQVAGSSEMTSVEEVGVEGMYPIYGSDIVPGTYEVTVECSSSMFKIEKAQLTVQEDGQMEAVLTMGGSGYLKLFMGTGQEAAEAELSEYIDFVENENGQQTYTIPVEALDQSFSCAAFSKNKEKWYDRNLLIEAKSLPEDAVLVELPDYEALEKAARDKRIEAMKQENSQNAAAEPVSIDRKDGEYTIEVDLEGGSGRASVTSPAVLIVKEGKAYARIEWSSPNYDYMLVGGEKYLPVQTEGNSTFEIPVAVMDEPMTVIADTTAMSTPHEIEYTLTFHSDSIPADGMSAGAVIGIAAAAAVILAAILLVVRKKKAAK